MSNLPGHDDRVGTTVTLEQYKRLNDALPPVHKVQRKTTASDVHKGLQGEMM